MGYPVNERVLAYQKIALNQCLSADVLARLENQVLLVDAGTDSLRPSEVFRALTDGVWAELNNPGDMSKEKPFALSTIRRNLQREHARKLGQIVLGNRRSGYDDVYGYVMFSNAGTYPADARSLARMHLKEINDADRQVARHRRTRPSTTPPAPTWRSAGSGSARFLTRTSRRTSLDRLGIAWLTSNAGVKPTQGGLPPVLVRGTLPAPGLAFRQPASLRWLAAERAMPRPDRHRLTRPVRQRRTRPGHRSALPPATRKEAGMRQNGTTTLLPPGAAGWPGGGAAGGGSKTLPGPSTWRTQRKPR